MGTKETHTPQPTKMGCMLSTEDEDVNNGAPSPGPSPGPSPAPSRHSSAIDQVKNVNQLMTDKFKTNAHHLRNIFTAPLEDIAKDYRAPVFEKSPEEEAFIREALKHNFVFDNLGEKEIKVIVRAHEPYSAQKDATLINEGDEGDYFYILREGTVKYLKGQKEVGNGTEGSSFGELALLYSAPRAASVVCTRACHLYRLDQITFRKILQSQVRGEDQEKMEVLQKVPFLKELDPQDLHKLADAMKPKSYKKGEILVRKGDEGDAFYVIKEGKVKVTDISVGNRKYEDMVFESGAHLGERALLLKEPRAATCFALTDVQTLTIDADTFMKVLGEYTTLVLRSQDQMKLVSTNGMVAANELVCLSQSTL
jgi:cAMP-dependent protein kinase regulator